MISTCIRKGVVVPRSLGNPLSPQWWGKGSAVISRHFSGPPATMVLRARIPGKVVSSVSWKYSGGVGGGGITGALLRNGPLLRCDNCAAGKFGGGAWLLASRTYSSQIGRRGEERGSSGGASSFKMFSRLALTHGWVLDGVRVRFKGGYSNFGHNPRPVPKLTRYWTLFIVSTIILLFVNWPVVLEWLGVKDYLQAKLDKFLEPYPPKVDAADISEQHRNDKLSVGGVEESSPAKKAPKLGFRDRKIIEYENRIRQYSTPDKTFRYFATLQVIHPSGDNEVFMTPDDFLRSITPGIKQPEGLGLDQFKRYDPKLAGRLELELPPDSIFYKLGSHGLISFSDYVFLLTVLSTSRRHFEIAFRMFDLNGDGDVDVEEFEKVTALIRQRTSVGARHREINSGNSLKETNSALNSYFFGPSRREKLTIEKFLDFQQQLQTEILNLEFRRKGPDEKGKISESDFSELLLAYAGYPAKRKARMLKRVKKKSKEEGYATGVSLDDYLKFFHLLSNIQDVDTALTFYHIAGAAIDPITLKHVARTVAHVELSDHIIDVVFTLFDENQDGQLSNREFVAVMKNRLMRGLEKPKDTGFFKLLTSIGRCAKESIPR